MVNANSDVFPDKAKDISKHPFALTKSEVDSLRQDFKAAMQQARAEIKKLK